MYMLMLIKELNMISSIHVNKKTQHIHLPTFGKQDRFEWVMQDNRKCKNWLD